MNLRLVIVLACTLLGLSACVIELRLWLWQRWRGRVLRRQSSRRWPSHLALIDIGDRRRHFHEPRRRPDRVIRAEYFPALCELSGVSHLSHQPDESFALCHQKKHFITHHWFKNAIVLATVTLSASSALAQSPAVDATNSPSQNQSSNGPAGTYEHMTTTRTTVARDGARTDTTERFDKTQSYTGGNGALTARPHIETTGPATTTDTSHQRPIRTP